MKNYSVRRYNSEDYAIWNDFISKAKNATFLFHRDFMEYHSDRFVDFSLLIFENNKLISILPANEVDSTIYSHQGLTYGGFVFSSAIKLSEVITITKLVLAYLHSNHKDYLQLKLIPSIYPAYFSEEIDYTLFLLNAKLTRRDVLSVIEMSKANSLSISRSRCVERGVIHNLVIKEEARFEQFWNEILIPNLNKKHKVNPVHTAQEIALLHQKFPENIRHFNVYYEDKIVAGTTVFITDTVAHPQYISGNKQKNELGSLDFLYNYLIKEVFNDKIYFDFGPSNEENGRKINEGILFWKESFGARATVQSFYEVKTSNYSLLENIMI